MQWCWSPSLRQSCKEDFPSPDMLCNIYALSHLQQPHTIATSVALVHADIDIQMRCSYELKKPEIDDALATGHARTKQLYDQHVAPQGALLLPCFRKMQITPNLPTSL